MAAIPDGLEVTEGDGLRIAFRWRFRDRTMFLGLLLGSSAFAASVLLTRYMDHPAPEAWVRPTMIGAAIYFAVFGLAMTYWTIAKLVNRTELSHAGGEVRVLRGPIPFPSVRILRGEIREVTSVNAAIVNGVRTAHVVATLTDGRTKRILSWVRVPWAEYIVARLNATR